MPLRSYFLVSLRKGEGSDGPALIPVFRIENGAIGLSAMSFLCPGPGTLD